MNHACHYAILRFLPYVETGEFANVGIVLFCPSGRYFGFRLLTNRHARVTNFFDELDAKVYKAAIRTFREELLRISEMFKPLGTDLRRRTVDKDGSMALWRELIKNRETMIRFSESRFILGNPKEQLEKLFRFYVERNFVTRVYQEQALERGVQSWLKAENLQGRFTAARIGNDEYNAQFPFVEFEGEHPAKVIKPLNLDYPDAAKIIDHGGQWLVRINALKKRNLLPPRVLFAVDGLGGKTSAGKARTEVISELESSGVSVAPFRDRQHVIQFARAAI